MLKTYRIIPLVFILFLFGFTFITVAPVFAQEQWNPSMGMCHNSRPCMKMNQCGDECAVHVRESKGWVNPGDATAEQYENQNQAQKQIEKRTGRTKLGQDRRGLFGALERKIQNGMEAELALRKNNKGIKDDKIWFCEQFTGCRWGSRCADVRIGGGYPIGLVSPADAKRIDGQYLNQCGEGLYAWATQPHGGNAYMQATCKTWGRCDDAELEIDLAKGKRPDNPCAGTALFGISKKAVTDFASAASLGLAGVEEICTDYMATDYGRDDSVDMAEKEYTYEGSCHGDPRCVYWCRKSTSTWLDKQGVCKRH